MFIQSRHVQRGAVPFVLCEGVMRVKGVQCQHHAVSGYLGEDTGGRDTEAQAVAADKCSLRDRKGSDGKSVDERMIRRHR